MWPTLLMVRASARDREIGIRAALGASRTQLVRQLLTESLLLSGAGAVFGTVFAWLGVSTITSMGRTAFPRLATTQLDGRTLMFTVVVAFVTGLVFGVVPALQASQGRSHEALKEGGRGTSTSYGHQRL